MESRARCQRAIEVRVADWDIVVGWVGIGAHIGAHVGRSAARADRERGSMGQGVLIARGDRPARSAAHDPNPRLPGFGSVGSGLGFHVVYIHVHTLGFVRGSFRGVTRRGSLGGVHRSKGQFYYTTLNSMCTGKVRPC